MEDKYGYHTGPEVCTNCGSKQFEDTSCINCGKFIGETVDEYEQREEERVI